MRSTILPLCLWRLEPTSSVGRVFTYVMYYDMYYRLHPVRTPHGWQNVCRHPQKLGCLLKERLGFLVYSATLYTRWIPIRPIDWGKDGSPATECYETYQVLLN